MRKKTALDAAELIRLKDEKRLSLQALANRFGVSRATMQRRLSAARGEGEKDTEVMCSAAELERFARTVANPVVKKEIFSLVYLLRTRHAASVESKKKRIIAAVELGAREIEEIADDCQMRSGEVLELLETMVAENRIEKRARGGLQNRGRKTKYHYFVSIEKIKISEQLKS